MSSFVSPEEQRALHHQNVMNARLGIVAALLGIGAAYYGFREAADARAAKTNLLDPAVVTTPATTAAPAQVQAPSPAVTPSTKIPAYLTPPVSAPGPVPPAPPAGASPTGGQSSPAPIPAAPIPAAPVPAAPKPAPERYVNAGVVRALAGGGPVAILVMRGDDGVEQRAASALAHAGVNTRTGAFTSAAFRDGVVERLSAGDAGAMSELGLSSVNGHLVVARLSFDPVQSTMNDLMMTHASLSVQIVPLGGGGTISRAFRARGAGFNGSAALQQAESRVLKDLAEALSSL